MEIYNSQPLILASASNIRRQLLENAGIKLEVIPSDVDEGVIKQSMKGQSATLIAAKLAAAKALKISLLYPDRLIIGADQILSFKGECYDKPANLSILSAQLKAFRGQSHQLISAVAIYKKGEAIGQISSTATLTMRDFSDDFLAKYVKIAGEAGLKSVGGYQLEGLGLQLFEAIEGDYFTILGLPMFDLLAFLRKEGVLIS